ncbi:hypothetical protein FB446DRAFT_228687 [Lentinula raphanica]|nr:hypothetical protein FB446DRAFT_228687 [Lentinula raphanica]
MDLASMSFHENRDIMTVTSEEIATYSDIIRSQGEELSRVKTELERAQSINDTAVRRLQRTETQLENLQTSYLRQAGRLRTLEGKLVELQGDISCMAESLPAIPPLAHGSSVSQIETCSAEVDECVSGRPTELFLNPKATLSETETYRDQHSGSESSMDLFQAPGLRNHSEIGLLQQSLSQNLFTDQNEFTAVDILKGAISGGDIQNVLEASETPSYFQPTVTLDSANLGASTVDDDNPETDDDCNLYDDEDTCIKHSAVFNDLNRPISPFDAAWSSDEEDRQLVRAAIVSSIEGSSTTTNCAPVRTYAITACIGDAITDAPGPDATDFGLHHSVVPARTLCRPINLRSSLNFQTARIKELCSAAFQCSPTMLYYELDAEASLLTNDSSSFFMITVSKDRIHPCKLLRTTQRTHIPCWKKIFIGVHKPSNGGSKKRRRLLYILGEYEYKPRTAPLELTLSDYKRLPEATQAFVLKGAKGLRPGVCQTQEQLEESLGRTDGIVVHMVSLAALRPREELEECMMAEAGRRGYKSSF